MKALVLDIPREDWETTKGMTIMDVPEPELDESRHPADSNKCIFKSFLRSGLQKGKC